MVASDKTLIDSYLEEQRRLQTPVARFGRAHDGPACPALAPVYRDLIPLTAPGPGEQYAFEVDLDACTGCKACVAACHSLNGLEENETWRDTGLLVGGDAAHPFQQVVTTACHHCADPACLNGCPVLAYEKDPATGIVRHLGDQCIGCQYCVLLCPYDVPKYSERLGIVRKCDMCHSRLSAGEAPACAQACPTQAISIVTVRVATNLSEWRLGLGRSQPRVDTSSFLPAAPDPSYTQPTTRYVTQRALPENLRPADAEALRPQPPHEPLVWMLVLTQLSVGALAAAILADSLRQFVTYYVTSAWLAAAAGLAASVLHLGQPRKAWRCFLGLRRSWLSREIAAFGLYFATLSLLVGASLLATGPVGSKLPPALVCVTLAFGLAGIFCSAMLYADTRRRAWRLPVGAGKFFATALIAALALTSLPAAAIALGAKLLLESAALRGNDATARLQRGPLRPAVARRFALGGGALLAFAGGLALPGLALFAAGELAERCLFFRSVDAPKMPGLPSA